MTKPTGGGLVTPKTDPDVGQKEKRYAYDPHLDPRPIIEAVRRAPSP